MPLNLPTTSEELIPAPELDSAFRPETNYDLAVYLRAQFDSIDSAVIEGADGRGDPGFWAAVTLCYFDLLTPGYPHDQKSVKAANAYIPASGQ